MKKIIAGAIRAPAIVIIIYVLFGILDLITTYIASSDLKYESNWVIRKFGQNWTLLIIYLLFIYLSVVFAVSYSLDQLNQYFLNFHFDSFRIFFYKSIKNCRFLFYAIILGIFYSHLLSAGHIIINNYLSHIYLHSKEENWLKEISIFYINRQKYFLFYIQYLIVIPGYILALIKVNNLRKKAVAEKHSVTTE